MGRGLLNKVIRRDRGIPGSERQVAAVLQNGSFRLGLLETQEVERLKLLTDSKIRCLLLERLTDLHKDDAFYNPAFTSSWRGCG